jgi:hypothetical protein
MSVDQDAADHADEIKLFDRRHDDAALAITTKAAMRPSPNKNPWVTDVSLPR